MPLQDTADHFHAQSGTARCLCLHRTTALAVVTGQQAGCKVGLVAGWNEESKRALFMCLKPMSKNGRRCQEIGKPYELKVAGGPSITT